MNKIEGPLDSYDLKYTDEDGRIFPMSLASVLFEHPYDIQTLEERAQSIALSLYPSEILTQVIIE